MLVAQVYQRRNALPSCPPAALESKLDWETQEYFENIGTQFPCFTGTKVQILMRRRTTRSATHFPPSCSARCSLYLLHWYKSTNTDAERAASCAWGPGMRVLGLRMLTDVCVCWHMLTYADVLARSGWRMGAPHADVCVC
jgi:hypothetical protein